jgi:hypothetical protein
MRVLGRIDPGSGSGPGTGHTGAGLGGRVAAGFFATALVALSRVAESAVALSGRGTRVVSCALDDGVRVLSVKAASPAVTAIRVR